MPCVSCQNQEKQTKLGGAFSDLTCPRHPGAPPCGMGRKHAVVRQQVDARLRRQRREAAEEVERVEQQRTRAITPWPPELGFCKRGEAKDFATVQRLSIGGELPINTSGGLLGEAYIHGTNGITECVRQTRGTSVNQMPDVEHVLVTAGTGVRRAR